MNWTSGLLTTREAEKALRAAGINPDPSAWSADDMERAAAILDIATMAKRVRKTR